MIVIFDCQRGAGERLHNNNDISMFEQVGLAVAMGNAVAEVRAAARLVTSANDDDGVARAVAMLLVG